MKKESTNKHMNLAIYGLVVVAGGAVFVMLLFALRDFLVNRQYEGILQALNPFIFGAVFAYLLNPLMSLYERKIFHKVHGRKRDKVVDTRIRRMLSLVASFLSAAVLLSLIALMIFPQIGVSVNQLAVKVTDLFSPADGAVITQSKSPEISSATFLQDADLESLLGDIGKNENLSGYDALMNTKLGVYITDMSASTQHFVSRFGFDVDIEQSLRDVILSATARMTVFFSEYFQTIINATASFIFTTAKQVLNVIIGIIIAFYILSDKERLFSQVKRILYALLPTPFVNKTIEITRTTHRIFGGFISGKLLDSLIIGVICFICMTLFRINYPMLISVIVGITNIIPFFGPFIGAIPSILFLLINDPSQGIWFAVFILILQQVDGNIIGPKILGSSLGLSSFWVIFSILVFSALMGPVGMFIGVPVFAVIYTLFKDFATVRLKKKGITEFAEGCIVPVKPDNPHGHDTADTVSASRRFSGLVDNLSKNIQSVINKTRRPADDAYDDVYDDDDDL